MNQTLISFYRGEGTDTRGRTLQQILGSNDQTWETSHDFVQWVFPLPEPSRFNPDAPLLDAETIEVFKTDIVIKGNIIRSLTRAEIFYKVHHAHQRKPVWFYDGDHNFLRLTRIMRFLALVDHREEAIELYRSLLLLTEKFGGPSETTLRFWADAVGVTPV